MGYNFVITFEAFDVNLPSVGFVYNFDCHREISQCDQRIADLQLMVILARNAAFSLFNTEFYVHFETIAYKRLIVMYASTLLTRQHTSNSSKLQYFLFDIRMHDGPGTLSPLLVPACNNMTQKCSYHLSGHHGVLKYRIPMPSNFAFGYKKMLKINFKDHGINWESIKVLNSSVDCVRQGDSIHFQGKSGTCWGLTPNNIMHIHALHLSGYACAYGGGLYIFYEQCNGCNVFDEEYICISIYSEVSVPFLRVHFKSFARLVIVFKTFVGYNDGWVNFTLSQDNNCIGMNYVGFTNLCNKIETLFDQYFNDHTNITSQSETCTDYWLIHHSMTTIHPSELCIYPLNPFIHVGSFNLTLTSSVAYENLAYLAGSHESTVFNMTIEADTVTDFPLNLNREKTTYSLKLPTAARRSFFFNPASNLHVKFNYFGGFGQLMFVIRMQITENAICNAVEYMHRPIDIAQMNTLNSDISNVYLSGLYPYNGFMIKSMKYTGHNRGSCRVLVKGQSCSHSLAYRVIRIHYWPNIYFPFWPKKLKPAHRIDISTKRTLNCSVACSLNVAVWEIVVTDTGTRLLYHEWRGIYHLTWQVLAASHQGFSLHVNATCDEDSCNSRLCDVAVAFNIMLKWRLLRNPYSVDLYRIVSYNKKEIQLPRMYRGLPDEATMYEISRTDVITGIPLKLGDLVYGSWNDAHEYCLSKNLYLSTLTASLMERLRYTLNMKYPENGWNHTDAYIFAGLHRKSAVSILPWLLMQQ